MKGIIWGATIASAESKLEEIIQDYMMYKISPFKRTRNEVLFNNGDLWKAVGAKEDARGQRCNISYIDTKIDSDFIETIIKPGTIAYPYHAFNFYNQE